MSIRTASIALLVFGTFALLGCPEEGPQGDDDIITALDDDTTASDVEHVPGAVDDDEAADPEDDWIFDLGVVHEFQVEIAPEHVAALEQDPEIYVPATFRSGEESLEIGVRLKGASTFQPLETKPSLKVKFDFLDQDAQFHGCRSLNLHNMTLDPSYMGEALAYLMYREAGVPASRTGWAAVSINGEYRGIYCIVEQKNGRFLERWWDDTQGSLYEAGRSCDVDECEECLEIDRVGEDDNLDELIQFCGWGMTTGDIFLDAMQERLDWEVFLNAMAIERVIAHYDGYSLSKRNYHLYHEPAQDQWTFTPWSLDIAWGLHAFGSPFDHGVSYTDLDSYVVGRLVNTCTQIEECGDELDASVLAMADQLESLELDDEIARLEDLLFPHVLIEPFPTHPSDRWEQHVRCLDEWIAQRPDEIRVLLEQP